MIRHYPYTQHQKRSFSNDFFQKRLPYKSIISSTAIYDLNTESIRNMKNNSIVLKNP